jgi:hypothetical protein
MKHRGMHLGMDVVWLCIGRYCCGHHSGGCIEKAQSKEGFDRCEDVVRQRYTDQQLDEMGEKSPLFK